MGKRLAIITNPASGQDKPFLNIFNDTFRQHEIDWDLMVTKKADDGTLLAEKALADGYDVVAAYGGDGTVMEVARGLINTDKPLMILPGGTQNALALELGISPDLARAAALIDDSVATTRAIDVGIFNDKHFLIRAGLGYEAEIVDDASRELKTRFGMWAYFFAAVSKIRDPKMTKFEITIDGRVIEEEGFAFFVANSGSIGKTGFTFDPNIRLDDGVLDVLIMKSPDVGSLLQIITGVVSQNRNEDIFPRYTGKNVTVKADRMLKSQVDGDVLDETDFVEASILPHALKIIVPTQAAAVPADANGDPAVDSLNNSAQSGTPNLQPGLSGA